MIKQVGRKQAYFLAVVLAMGCAVVWYSVRYAEAEALAKLNQTAQDRLILYESTLHSALNRYRYLPYILAVNPEIQELLEDRGDPTKVNQYLEALNSEAGPAAQYIMNKNGITIASSNWRSPTSYMGHDFHFRPYFQDGIQGRRGLFFGLGVNTCVPGLFFSHPIRRGNEIIGAAVVKVELDRLQKEWREGGETLFVTDENGVIVLSTREEWVYRSLIPHDGKDLARIQAEEQYRGVILSLLPTQSRPRALLTELGIGPERFLMGSRRLEGLNWQIHFLEPAAKVDEQVRAVAGVGMAAVVLLGLLGVLARERYLRHLSRQKALEANRIHLINQQLETEVRQRRRKERELKQTQKELIHAGQMAALGQMAASVAHELNQPLAAIKMFSANCKVMMERGQHQAVLENLETIHELTVRLASVSNQLKSFSRKSAGRRHGVDLRQSLRNALSLLRHMVDGMGCRIETQEPDEPLVVQANAMHMDQVFVNLLQNSLDAMRDSPERRIDITLRRDGGWAEAMVRDSGPGLSPEAKERLFSPFFTTKEPGLGLGLGLSIIHGIIRNMNGEIQGSNLEGGGACFTVRLALEQNG